MDQRKEFVRRVEEHGLRGLQPQSRAPHSCPHKTPARIADLLIAAKLKHPDWGPGLLLEWLRRRHREIRAWPAVSTAGAILKREGLVKPRRKRSPRTHPGVVDPITDVRTTCGPRTSKGSSGRRTASIAIRSRSRISTRASC